MISAEYEARNHRHITVLRVVWMRATFAATTPPTVKTVGGQQMMGRRHSKQCRNRRV